VRLFLF